MSIVEWLNIPDSPQLLFVGSDLLGDFCRVSRFDIERRAEIVDLGLDGLGLGHGVK